MSILSDKARRGLRKVFRGLGAAAVSLVFQACYGPPMDTVGAEDDAAIRGVVKSRITNQAIPNIKVSVNGVSSFDLTDSRGGFYLYVPKEERYVLTFADIDGTDNGGLFKTETREVTLADTNAGLDITLEEDAQ